MLLGEPKAWGRADTRLWEASEARLGVALPSDYKAFMDLYGPGVLNGFLGLSRPVDGTEQEAESLWGPYLWGGTIDEQDYPDWVRPWAGEGRLITWGGVEDGTLFHFLALEPDPDDWRIVITSAEDGDCHETAGPFVEFLLRCHDGVDRPSFILQSWMRGGVTYEQDDTWGDEGGPRP
ncbi:SMI1/KNR4 family protein [Kitasatospora sp. NPDC004240]